MMMMIILLTDNPIVIIIMIASSCGYMQIAGSLPVPFNYFIYIKYKIVV